jgi:hypothetical protein
MDFFGGLSELLDDIIPESDDIIGVFDDAAEFLTGGRKAKSSGTLQQSAKTSSSNAFPTGDGLDTFTAERVGQNIARGMSRQEPLESIDPRQVQANWMSRLSSFASDEIPEKRTQEKLLKRVIQKAAV